MSKEARRYRVKWVLSVVMQVLMLTQDPRLPPELGVWQVDRFSLLTPALGPCSFLRNHFTEPEPPLTSRGQYSP